MSGLMVEVATEADMDEIFALRYEVFVLGQAVPAELERDALDACCDHVLARADGVLVGTGRLVPGRVSRTGQLEPASVVTVGRLAVAASSRGSGIGARLLALLEDQARRRGSAEVELHAQLHARGFYERAGYAAFGPVYEEAGIDHLGMRKAL